MSAPKKVAFLGDSLTAGATGAELHDWGSRLDVDPALCPRVMVANYGKPGDQSGGFLTRYQAGIQNKSFDLVCILGCKNDATNDIASATTWANIQTIVNAVIAEGKFCWLLSDLPFKAAVDWTSGRQVLLDATRANFQAKALTTPGVTFVDTYAAAGAPGDPQTLRIDWAYPDNKHLSAAGNVGFAAFLLPKLVALYPSTASVWAYAWTIADVRRVAPEFAAISDAVITTWIVEADRRVNGPLFGARVVDAGAELTAHLMAMAGIAPYLAGAQHTGQVIGQTVGQVSVQFASQAARGVLKSMPSLALSRHGIMYAELIAIGGFGLQGIP